MKRAFFLLGLAAAVLLGRFTVFAQEAPEVPSYAYNVTLPLHGLPVANAPKARHAVSGAVALPSGLPVWTYTVTSPADGLIYNGTMVGSSPFFNGARTTNIPTVVIPLIIKMPDGSTFDPTASDRCTPWGNSIAQVLASPLFQPTSFTMKGINMGTGQYIDEFQRANFYNANVSATGDSYHTVLSPVTTLPAQTITLPNNLGTSVFLGGCAVEGIMDLGTFDSIISNTLIPSLTSQGLLDQSSFPIFIIHDVVMGNPGISISSHCCVIGYHSALGTSSGIQTYAVADFDTSHTFQNPDIQPLSHEVGEWMDDPYGTNPTPRWGHVGQVSGCQGNLEVGDPLSGIPPALYQTAGTYGVTMPGGHTYYPQDLAFFSWFYRQSPSIGVGGVYSAGSTLLSPPFSVCQG